LLLALLILSTASCNNNKLDPEITTVSETTAKAPLDDSYVASELEHYCAWASTMKHHNDIPEQVELPGDDIPNEITVKLSGDEKVLNYRERSIAFSDGQIVDLYSNEEETISVAAIRDSGAYMVMVDLEARNDPSVKTRDECFSIAKNYLLNYASDNNNYILTEEKVDTGIQTHYRFTFQRKIGDIFAEDRVYIDILENGNIEHMEATKPGSLEGVSADDLPDVNAARPYALKKLKSICDGMNEYTYTFKETGIRAEAFKGDIIALTYTFEVTFTSKGESKWQFPDVIRIAVYENKNKA